MRVELRRAWYGEKATMGMLTIVGQSHHPIFTLENPLRQTTKDSLIPAGSYLCQPYSGTKYKDVYILNNVPGRTAILIHWGNTEKDTEGCILLGLGGGVIAHEPAVLSSRAAFDFFASKIGKNNFTLSIF